MFAYANRKATVNQTFFLWLTYIQMVQTLLLFHRATRENNWNLHMSAVCSMLPWFFAMYRVNYARYGTVYWLEMSCFDIRLTSTTFNVRNRTALLYAMPT